MDKLEDAYELISMWRLDKDGFIIQNLKHHMNDGYPDDNSSSLYKQYVDSLEAIMDFGLKEAKKLLDKVNKHDPKDSKCWHCESTLEESPNNHWWTKKTYNEGICYRCVLSLARSVLISMERTPKIRKVEDG